MEIEAKKSGEEELQLPSHHSHLPLKKNLSFRTVYIDRVSFGTFFEDRNFRKANEATLSKKSRRF